MNVVQTDRGQLVEVQATAEKSPFSRDFAALMKLADTGHRGDHPGPEGAS